MNLNPLGAIDALRAIPDELQDHTVDAAGAAQTAIDATSNEARLDAAAQAVDSLDHLVSDTRRIPFAKEAFAKEYTAYTLAKAGLTAFVASGVVPGARELVGAQDLLAAQSHLHAALGLVTSSPNGISVARANDWMGHALGDAADALLQLREPGIALPLLGGLSRARAVIQSGAAPTTDQLTTLTNLFTRAGSAFAAQRAAAPTNAAPTTAANASAVAALDAALAPAAGLEPTSVAATAEALTPARTAGGAGTDM